MNYLKQELYFDLLLLWKFLFCFWRFYWLLGLVVKLCLQMLCWFTYKWQVCRTKCNWIGNTSQVLVLLHVNIRTHFKGRIFTILLNFTKNTTETQKLAGCKVSKKQCMMETKLYFCLVSMFLSKNHTFHV